MEMYFLKMYDKNRNIICDAKMYFFFSGNKNGLGSTVKVLPGSIMNNQSSGSKTYLSDCGKAIEKLLKSGAIKEREEKFEFIKEYKFNSPSQAAAILKGNDCSDSWLRIINTNGESLDKIYRNNYYIKNRLDKIKNFDEKLKVIVSTLSNMKYEYKTENYSSFIKNTNAIIMNILDYVLELNSFKIKDLSFEEKIKSIKEVDYYFGENLELLINQRTKYTAEGKTLEVDYVFWVIMKYFNEYFVNKKSIKAIIDVYIIANTNKRKVDHILPSGHSLNFGSNSLSILGKNIDSQSYNLKEDIAVYSLDNGISTKFSDISIIDLMIEIKKLKNIVITGISELDKRNEARTERVIDEFYSVKADLMNILDSASQVKQIGLSENESVVAIYELIDDLDADLAEEGNAQLRWVKDIGKLDDKSIRFLIIAEKINEFIDEQDFEDKSLPVLQYCRVLENEMFLKIFDEFFKQMKHLTTIDRLNVMDITHLNEKYDKIIKELKLYCIHDTIKPKIELGSMVFYLTQFKKDMRNRSILNKHFNDFFLSNFDKDLISNESLYELRVIARDYRNKAAHTEEISCEFGAKAIEDIKNAINRMLFATKGGDA